MTDQPDQRQGQIKLSLQEHNVGMILPAGGRIEGRMSLPTGALIAGDFIGDILCETGSVIIAAKARFRGTIEADRIYIEGEVSSSSERRSMLIGRQLIAGSSFARINADLYAKTFALHKAKVWGCLHALEDLNRPATALTGNATRGAAPTQARSQSAAPLRAVATTSARQGDPGRPPAAASSSARRG